MQHYFNIYLANDYGVNEAIMCHNMYFWIEQNKANNINFKDGRYWTYNTMDAFCKLFIYWNRYQVERILKSCKDQGLLITGMYNEKKYDRTVWYSTTDLVNRAYAPPSTPLS